jgi:autotransporter family porin
VLNNYPPVDPPADPPVDPPVDAPVDPPVDPPVPHVTLARATPFPSVMLLPFSSLSIILS